MLVRGLAFSYLDCLEQLADRPCLCKTETTLLCSLLRLSKHYFFVYINEIGLFVFPTEKMQVFWLWHVLAVEELCRYLLDSWFSFQFLVSQLSMISLYFDYLLCHIRVHFSPFTNCQHFYHCVGKFGAVFASIPPAIVAALYCLFFAYVGMFDLT